MSEKETVDQKVSFKDTLHLPRTDFPIRPNAKIEDQELLKRWQEQDLYKKTFYLHEGNEKFIFHDGPPYANGHLHLGHAYNNILKDVVAKVQRMFGKQVPVTPGWDCHGLPIELKVAQENPAATPEELKKACRVYAQHWIDVQKEERKKLGVLFDFDRPYLTMSYSYEASTIRAFGKFVALGYIERKNKTVPWCPSCQTVLATAEIEYQDRKDPSIYVQFPLPQAVTDKVLPALAGKPVSFLVWTTTPWTLPLNRAVLLKPNSPYVVVDINGTYVVVGAQLADKVCALLGVAKNIVAEVSSEEFVGNKVGHPFIENLQVPLLVDQSVLLEDGTACVHSAPGCGPDDYEVGIKNNLEIFSPISPDGKYTAEVVPPELVGMPVADGQIWVLRKLTEVGRLLFKTNIKHPYPHCWRCRNGLIFRATKQWFCDLEKNNLKHRVLDAVAVIQNIPKNTKNRLLATVEGRLEWCLSRQRIWGTPIPALVCVACDQAYTSEDLINNVADHVENQGIEYWDTVAVADVIPQGLVCSGCNGSVFKKEMDILDVWFDSGVSQWAVLKKNPELAFPADMYLEGKDQHRGWFQSSLLTSMVLNNEPPMKIIFTHGYTVDDKGRKMSKSLGNVVAPEDISSKLGTDGLRLWASSIDNASDPIVSDALMVNLQEVYRKIRNTCRFLISLLYDYDHEKDAVKLDDMLMIDRYALQRLFEVNQHILQAYARYDFTAVYHELTDYCIVDLSAFYLDIIKDRLYVEKADSVARRSAQTACWYILDTITRLIAPILSFTAEHVSDHYQKNKTESIHLQEFSALTNIWELMAEHLAGMLPTADLAMAMRTSSLLSTLDKFSFVLQHETQWTMLKDIRSALLKAIELQREKGLIKHPLEARLTVYFDTTAESLQSLPGFLKEVSDLGQDPSSFFKDFLIVSQFGIVQDKQGLEQSEYSGMFVAVDQAVGDKCPRCWHVEVTTHEHKLCKRCQAIVG